MAKKPTTPKPFTNVIGDQLNTALNALKNAEEEAAQLTIKAMIKNLSIENFTYLPEADEDTDPSYWTVNLHQEELTEWSFARFEATQAFKDFKAELVRRDCNFYRATDGELYYNIDPA